MEYRLVENEFESAKSIGAEMVITRQAQEVQAAMVVAKRFPRDVNQSFNRIMRACERRSLAEDSMYEYKRGDTKVIGPSIRLAEAIAQNWGNIDFGIMELEQRPGESQMMAYAWDLETNTRSTKIFTVKHWRDTKSGGYALKDARDIYEITANMGARRVRACILGVIPGDVTEKAVEQCKKTLTSGSTKLLADRIRDMIVAFDKAFSVKQDMLEKYIGCKADAFSENDMIRLGGVYKSLRDGMASREDIFEISPAKTETTVKSSLDEPEASNGTEQQKLS